MAATNTQAWALSDAQRDLLERWLAEFDSTWGEERLAARVRELPQGSLRFPALVELVKIDLERQWQTGMRLTVESYLGIYPELGTPDTVPADLLQSEWEVRQRHGEDVSLTAYAARFPGRAEDLRRLLDRPPPPGPGSNFSTVFPAAEAATDTARLTPAMARLEQLGRYRIVRKLGQGGMGAVYLAHDTELDRSVALKVPHFAEDDGPEVVERFYREARAAAALRHANICSVHDVFKIDGAPYLTMEYIEGESLAKRLAAGPPLSPARAAALVRDLAKALAVAHGQGVIHRDLKPANVMIKPGGEPVIMDFGLARRTGKGDVCLTHPGAVMGTPAYMSPEQAAGDPSAVGPSSDIYSLGVMLYQLTTGRLPFDGTLADVLYQVRAQEPKPPRALRPELSPQLEAIIMRAMAKAVDKRYASAVDFAAALDDYLREEEAQPEAANRPAPSRPTATVARPPEKPSGPPRRWVWVAAGFGLVVLASGLVIWWISGRNGPPDQQAAAPTAGIGGADDPTGRERAATPPDKAATPPDKAAPPGKPAGKPQALVVIRAAGKKLDAWDASPDGKTIVRVLGESVELWDADKGKLRATLNGPPKDRWSINISPDSRFLAVGGYRRVKVWDLKDDKELAEFEEPKEDVLGLLFSADGKRLCGVDAGGFACVWNVAKGKVLKTAELGSDIVRRTWYIFPGRNTILTLVGPSVADQVLLNTTDLTTKKITVNRGRQMEDVSISADGKRLLVGEGDDVNLYDMDTGKSQHVNHSHTQTIYMVSLSPDGKLAASSSEDKTAVLWDLEAGKKRDTYTGFEGPVGVRFSPDGKTLLAWTVKKGTTVRRWDMAAGKELTPLSGHNEGVSTVFFRGEGQYLFVVEDDGKVTRYDAAGLPQ